jgi:hypothetical protein
LSAVDRSQKLSALLRSLKSSYEPVEVKPRDAVDELVYSMLLWESNTAKAERALRRVQDAAADVNELRVFRPEHLELVLGERYPIVEERCRRLVCVLNGVYQSAHEVTLAHIEAMPKRDGRKTLESIDGMPPYVAARVTLYVLGGHAIPIDDRMATGLVASGVIEESDADCARASAVLERMVKAAEGPGVAALLQAWGEDGAPPQSSGRAAKGTTRTAAKKKTTTKKKTKKRTTSK